MNVEDKLKRQQEKTKKWAKGETGWPGIKVLKKKFKKIKINKKIKLKIKKKILKKGWNQEEYLKKLNQKHASNRRFKIR